MFSSQFWGIFFCGRCQCKWLWEWFLWILILFCSLRFFVIYSHLASKIIIGEEVSCVPNRLCIYIYIYTYIFVYLYLQIYVTMFFSSTYIYIYIIFMGWSLFVQGVKGHLQENRRNLLDECFASTGWSASVPGAGAKQPAGRHLEIYSIDRRSGGVGSQAHRAFSVDSPLVLSSAYRERMKFSTDSWQIFEHSRIAPKVRNLSSFFVDSSLLLISAIWLDSRLKKMSKQKIWNKSHLENWWTKSIQKEDHPS